MARRRGQPARGRTRCMYCEKRFTDTPGMPTVGVDTRMPTPGRPGYLPGRADGSYQAIMLWHQACLAEFEDGQRQYREQVRQDNLAQARAIAEAAGLDFDAISSGSE